MSGTEVKDKIQNWLDDIAANQVEHPIDVEVDF
jgi:hypothetical protein